MEVAALVGARVVVRSTDVGDVAALLDFYDGNRAHLDPWESARAAGFTTEGFWVERLRTFDDERDRGRSHHFVIVPREERWRVIGTLSLTTILPRAPVWNARVGYALDARHEGQGVMSEALGLAIRYAFDKLRLRRLLAGYVTHNVRSARVLARAGFVREGYFREFLYVGGRWEDHIETSLINPDWTAEGA